jgi:hypothetical protein
MAGSCWRLLAACSLIFVGPIFVAPILASPILPLGQETVADRSSLFGLPAPNAPARIPRLPDPRPPYPGVHGNSDFQRLVFRQLVRSAGIIFSGRVTFIGHAASPSRPDPASTTVTFRVENAIRGTALGQNLTIREWAGLWSGGERYRVGDRILLFLYSPGRLGLTSPVAGAMGKFAMDSKGEVVMSGQHVAIFAWDPILSGKAVVSYADFALAVRRSIREE